MILSDAARELRNKKAREYYQTHKRQYAEANRRYWEKKAAEEQAKAQTNAPAQYTDTPTPAGESANTANKNK